MREIAAEAGVTYSLVNRHLGTKDELLDRLLARYEQRWQERTADAPTFAEAATFLLGDRADTGVYLRLLAWSLLGEHDEPPAAAHRRHARLHELVPAAESLGLTTEQAEERVAATLAVIFGWRFFAPFIVDVLRLPAGDEARLHQAIGGLLEFLGGSPPVESGPAIR